jgi:hypothetical protein
MNDEREREGKRYLGGTLIRVKECGVSFLHIHLLGRALFLICVACWMPQ